MMDGNNWRPAQGETNPNIDASEWRTQLSTDSRNRIVNKILETLKKHLPIPGPEGLVELQKIASRFEEKIFSAATSQNDYLRRISMKMLSMESKSPGQPAGLNTLQSVSTGGNQNAPDLGTQAQQQLAMGDQSQSRQQVLQQNLQTSITSSAVQNSVNLPSVLQPGLSQTTNITGQSTNLQSTVSGISQNSGASPVGVPGNILGTTQRQQQLQGRQQQISTSQQLNMYQQQLLKQKLQHQVQPSLLQSHLQQAQQPLLQSQMQGSQQSLMQMSSGLSASQAAVQQTQSSVGQQSTQSSMQQNQTILQQPISSSMQQHQHSVIRQQQSQASSLHQQLHMGQQQVHPSSQTQQHLGQQSNGSGITQSQLLSQQSSVSDVQQRLMGHHSPQLVGQQNNISSMHPHLGPQASVTNMQPQQHAIRLQPQQQQQANQAITGAVLQSQSQQMQPPSQQLLTQLQSQALQQQLGLQQQPNSLQREMQQRMQASASLLQPQNTIEQQKQQLFQSQRAQSEASASGDVMTGKLTGLDWQEEIYQKIKCMKETYAPELTDMFNKICQRCLQADVQGSKNADRIEKIKGVVENMLNLLNISKSHIDPSVKNRLPLYEKQIVSFLSSQKQKKPPAQAQPPNLQSQSQLSMSQQLPAQLSNLSQLDNHMNQMPSFSSQSSVTSSIQQGPLSSTHLGASQSQQSTNLLQQPSGLELVQGSLSSLPQGVMNSLHQNTANMSQQGNMNSLSQCGVSSSQTNLSILQQNANILQHHQQQMKPQAEQQQQQMMQQQQVIHNQQFKQQIQQRLHPQLIQQQQKQLLLQQQQQLQQQQLHHQQKQQMSQLQMNSDLNDMKVRQAATLMKQGMFSQHQLPGARPAYYHQQMKAGTSFPISSPQLQSQSPQISQHSSPQIDHLNALTKTSTPQQTANSTCVAPSPPSILSQSPAIGEAERQISGVSSISNAGNVGHQQLASASNQSLAVSPPGISNSPLLAELSGAEGNRAGLTSVLGGKTNFDERPVDRLINVMKSISPKALNSSISDIGSVISLVDRMSGSAPFNGSRAAIGEDLAVVTKCRLQSKLPIQPDGNSVAAAKKMRRHLTAFSTNEVTSVASANNASASKLLHLEASDLESTATSQFRKLKGEINSALRNEIKQVNLHLVDTVVEISEEDESVAPNADEGVIVRCCFNAVAISPRLRSQLISAHLLPISPLKLFVPVNGSACSPTIMDKFLPDSRFSKEAEDLSVKARKKLSLFMRTLPQKMSIGDMAKAWDICVHEVILEYAHKRGGGSFTSRFGAWENCVSA